MKLGGFSLLLQNSDDVDDASLDHLTQFQSKVKRYWKEFIKEDFTHAVPAWSPTSRSCFSCEINQ